jgi:hypothetical protein
MHQHTRSRASDAGRARAGNTNGEAKSDVWNVRDGRYAGRRAEVAGRRTKGVEFPAKSNRDRVEPGPNTDKGEREAQNSRLKYLRSYMEVGGCKGGG